MASCYIHLFNLAFSADECLKMACADLQIYKLPSLEFEKVATRFQLPVRAVAFSPCGLRLAAAGDDDGIKLVHVADGKVMLPHWDAQLSSASIYACVNIC